MNDTILLVLFFTALLGLAPSALGDLRNARGVFVAYFVSGVVLPGVVAFSSGQGARQDVFEIVSPQGFKAIILCCMAFIIVVAVSISKEKTTIQPPIEKIYTKNEVLAKRFAWLSIFLSFSYLYAMSERFGGIAAMAYRLYQRVSLLDSVANFLSVFSYGSFVFAVMALSFARGSRRFPFWLAILAATIYLGQSLLLGGRSIVVLFFVSVFYTSFIKMKIGRAAIFSLVALMMIGSLSYYMTNLRYEAQSNGRRVNSHSDFTDTATTGITWVDHVAASIAYVEQKGHDGGQLYLNTLALPIPRDIWPSKPLQVSVEMRDFLYGDISGGNPPGLFGEAYIAFGSIGLLGVAVLLGFLIGQINIATTRAIRFDCRLRSAVTGILGPLYGFALVRGGIDIGAMRLGIPAFWCLISYWMVRNYAVCINVRRFEDFKRQVAKRVGANHYVARRRFRQGLARHPGRMDADGARS